MDLQELSNAVVRVGQRRGFIAKYRREYPLFNGQPTFFEERVIITAAHCLPRITKSLWDSRLYKNLIGPLNIREPQVWARPIFIDPVNDVAVLGAPDNQAGEEQGDAWRAYIALTENTPTLQIGKPEKVGTAWLLGLDREWFSASAKVEFNHLLIDRPTIAGMSGSPILNDDGRAIALVSYSSTREGVPTEGFQHVGPMLVDYLPGFLARTASGRKL
jgi:hypothetical protein